MPYHHDDEIDAILNVWQCLRERQYVLAAIGSLIWVIMVAALICMAPFAAIYGAYDLLKKLVLKFRRWAADKLRPKDVVRARNPEPASDLVAQFVDYEKMLVDGTETTKARSALISALAHIEQELEEHRLLAAEIRKLQVDNERPRRRDAILATQKRAERRREREQKERDQ